MEIEALGLTTLRPALRLIEASFSGFDAEERPEIELRASLGSALYAKLLRSWGMSENLRYWVALERGDVVGVVGLYHYEKDEKEAVWLGWFAVFSSHRRRGIGSSLLDLAIQEAKAEGKRFLRLYSSTDAPKLDAHRLFEGRGFLLVKREPWPGDDGLEKLYYQLDL